MVRVAGQRLVVTWHDAGVAVIASGAKQSRKPRSPRRLRRPHDRGTLQRAPTQATAVVFYLFDSRKSVVK